MKKHRTLPVLLSLALAVPPLCTTTLAAEVGPVVSSQEILLEGTRAAVFRVPMYSIEGSNYIKLRDLAVLLTSTEATFECSWNQAAGAIELTTGQPYTRVGGEWDPLAPGPTVHDSDSNVLLDGKPVQLKGYNLNNNNFFKLRDLGAALDVAVYWDHTREQVVVDPASTNADAAALEEASKEAPAVELETPVVELEMPSVELEPPEELGEQEVEEPGEPEEPEEPKEPEELQIEIARPELEQPGYFVEIDDPETERIRAVLNSLRVDYPEGFHWNNGTYYASVGLGFRGYGCAAFAAMCTDLAFGAEAPGRQYSDFESIRVGDILRVNYNSHSVVVLEVRPDSVIVTEGNYEGVVHWDRELTRSYLEAGNFFGTTRYPEG